MPIRIFPTSYFIPRWLWCWLHPKSTVVAYNPNYFSGIVGLIRLQLGWTNIWTNLLTQWNEPPSRPLCFSSGSIQASESHLGVLNIEAKGLVHPVAINDIVLYCLFIVIYIYCLCGSGLSIIGKLNPAKHPQQFQFLIDHPKFARLDPHGCRLFGVNNQKHVSYLNPRTSLSQSSFCLLSPFFFFD